MNYKFYLALFLLITGLILTGYFLISANKTHFEDYKFTSDEVRLTIPQEIQIQYMQLAKAYGERNLETCKEKGCGEIVEISKPNGALYGIKIKPYGSLE